MKEEQRKIMAKVIAKAWADEDYKKSLLANPKEILKNEGIDIPEGLKINIVEDSQDTVNMILPLPKNDVAIELNEDRKAALCHEMCDGSGLFCFF